MISIGLGNGLVPNRWHASTWANVDPDQGGNTASLGQNELKQVELMHTDLAYVSKHNDQLPKYFLFDTYQFWESCYWKLL